MTVRSLAAERGQRLYLRLAAERFWCDTCGGCHPLAEHRNCRQLLALKHAARARRALTEALGEQ